MDKNKERNLSLLADFYEFTMADGYLMKNMENKIAYFDLFFRNIPDNGGFAICCGLESCISYLKNLSFTEEDIEYFKSKNIFSDKFIDFIRNFKLEADIWAVPEGSVVFPGEPLITVRAKCIEAQILETMLLLLISHQSLIATKSSRIVRASKGRAVMEFGSRRAQGADAANLGARSAYIAGCVGSANTLADRDFKVPALGTMAHSWVQMFDSELEAFKAYAETFPNNTVLLVDTYDTLRSGVPNAIKTFDEVLKPMGIRPKGIRLDSGDIAYLSKQARKMLDDAGYEDVQITASSSLDEYKIMDLLMQGAKLDSFGVGEKLITSQSSPVFGGVYKLVATEEDGKIENKIKISENVEKITTPGFKTFYRLYDKNTGKAEADLITFKDEKIDDSKDLEIFHPIHTWKRKTLSNFTAREMMVKIFDKGNLVYKVPSLEEVKKYTESELDSMWEEVKRFEFPHQYIVDLSQSVWDEKTRMLNERNYKKEH